MVFQKPNPFPKSIYDNVAFGPRILGMEGDMDEIVEQALRRGGALGRGQGPPRRRTPSACPAASSSGSASRAALAVEPDVILMDEPCSALDPISTGKIEDLMMELKEDYSIVIVTHNMQQAARVSDMTAFLIVELDADEKHRPGELVEYDETEKIFTNPSRPAHRGLRHRQGGLMAGARRRMHYQEELRSSRTRRSAASTWSSRRSTGRSRRSSTRTSSSPRSSIADDDRIDGRYLEVHQGCSRCSRLRRRSRPTCA